ncbi:hypothetical protein Mal64_26800 [Pseudobythopirellula maris]|uniref:Dockerin domain-containing protein n=1 Tax=Pseudobythopirellula maris TaxID=2527991 RepID=A0A5C5ZJ45_9BACT|nr:hypothetical protein [Pseudobythopirellula maris]TWT87145.1 hypothetical protein Mal64_26800 [Pseudobythopirellula maris]
MQDADKTPTFDTPSDNWRYSTSSDSWKGFDLESVDPVADGRLDLYATALHELIHALGATTSNMAAYVGLDGSGDLVGENLVATYGGPVPAVGGHFAQNVQSIVWGSGDIVSEASLDPNALRGVRKHLTELDAALLRDLGYGVASQFPAPALAGDYNGNGVVDAADFTVWRDLRGSAGFGLAADGDGDGVVDDDDYQLWIAHFGQSLPLGANPTQAPEPRGLWLAIVAAGAAGLSRAPAGRRGC